jgi:hypothetical protein
MTYTPSYNVAIDQRDVVIRFKRDLIDQTTLNKFLDSVELESIRKRSQLTEEQAAELAQEIDRAVWESVKQAYAEA